MPILTKSNAVSIGDWALSIPKIYLRPNKRLSSSKFSLKNRWGGEGWTEDAKMRCVYAMKV